MVGTRFSDYYNSATAMPKDVVLSLAGKDELVLIQHVSNLFWNSHAYSGGRTGMASQLFDLRPTDHGRVFLESPSDLGNVGPLQAVKNPNDVGCERIGTTDG